jgi:hypothetical protein
MIQKAWTIKEVDKKRRRTVGILSSDSPDRDGELVEQKSLQARMPTFIEKNGIVLFMHGWRSGGIGRVTDWSGSEHETMVQIEYGKDIDIIYDGVLYSVENIWKQIEQGILRTHSFGFFAGRTDLKNGLYQLNVTDILEVSVVTIPANKDAVLQVAKMMDECQVQRAGSSTEVVQPPSGATARALALSLLRSQELSLQITHRAR